jgi:hypothetical protein
MQLLFLIMLHRTCHFAFITTQAHFCLGDCPADSWRPSVPPGTAPYSVFQPCPTCRPFGMMPQKLSVVKDRYVTIDCRTATFDFAIIAKDLTLEDGATLEFRHCNIENYEFKEDASLVRSSQKRISDSFIGLSDSCRVRPRGCHPLPSALFFQSVLHESRPV